MKEDLKSAARVTLINPLVTLDPVLAFRIRASGMDDGLGAALTTPTTDIDPLSSAFPRRLPEAGS
jgi:hypothetical protein